MFLARSSSDPVVNYCRTFEVVLYTALPILWSGKLTKRRKLPMRGKKNKARNIRTSRSIVSRKLTDKLIGEFEELILEGLPINKCCDYLGVSKTAFFEWKKKGEDYIQQLDRGETPERPEDEMYALFLQATSKAFAEWQLNIHRRSMQTRSKYSSMWVRDMTQLERRDRENWSRSETIAVTDAAPLPDDYYL